ncbi:DUF1810 domain-containing protein [Legionella clemsonensis]|uniref:DUF1810 domain-containing protein n=1 Tax=Legionella clemsonensis TaxID=1867846 RepID=A0A222P0Z9_9GAMM|nr:DUF1810 family protein [Legionella clemsonensis]ASQ45491.1 hypothetical protein clem_04665 [Legionella clemsonensis]
MPKKSTGSSKTINLQRFHEAQKDNYQNAHDEIASGRKRGHWIWYIFPQLKSLGSSATAQKYGIKDFEEACAYLKDPLLFQHYQEMVELVTDKLAKNIPPATLMNGVVDAQKLVSSLTLFRLAAEYLTKSENNSSLDFYKLEASCSKALNSLAHEGYLACEETMSEVYESPLLTAGVNDKETATVEDFSTVGEISTTQRTTPDVRNSLNFTSADAAPIVKKIVDTLIDNIQKKAGTRATWFNFNSETKVEKLKAISQWLEKNSLNESNQDAIIALIRDTCSIKRNIFGLFEPHSVQEFCTLLKDAHLKPASEKISFTPKELAQIKTSEQVDSLIQEKNTPQHLDKHTL